MNDRFFIFAGEPSGDLHGGRLLQALKKQFPSALFEGVGGPDMRSHGIKCCLHMEDFAVMGFTDVIKSFPKLWRQFNSVKKHILTHQPATVVLIDYPGFNLRLAKALRKQGYQGRIVQYICPTVWAWGKKRIPLMANTLDLLMTLYPFEEQCFKGTPLKVQFVGHPLIEHIASHEYHSDWKEKIGLPTNASIIAIFPGSRLGEISRNLPEQLKAAEILQKKFPEAVFAISFASEEIRQHIMKIAAKHALRLYFVPKDYLYDLMKNSQAAIAKSGTVTLELALHGCPTVVVYSLTPLNHFIAKYLIRLNLPHYCIVNILCQKTVFPELIAAGFEAENLAHELIKLFEEGPVRDACIKECKNISNLLHIQDGSTQAAKCIQELIK